MKVPVESTSNLVCDPDDVLNSFHASSSSTSVAQEASEDH